MAGGRTPGPAGFQSETIDSGTLARTNTSIPSPVGSESVLTVEKSVEIKQMVPVAAQGITEQADAEQTASSPVSNGLPQEEPEKVIEGVLVDSMCHTTAFNVSRENGSFALDIPSEPTEGELYLVQIIADSKEGSQFKVSHTGVCKKGTATCPSVTVTCQGKIIEEAKGDIAPLLKGRKPRIISNAKKLTSEISRVVGKIEEYKKAVAESKETLESINKRLEKLGKVVGGEHEILEKSKEGAEIGISSLNGLIEVAKEKKKALEEASEKIELAAFFTEMLLPRLPVPEVYLIKTTLCSGSNPKYSSRVEALIPNAWDGKIKIAYTPKTDEKAGQWRIDSSLKVSIDKEEKEVSSALSFPLDEKGKKGASWLVNRMNMLIGKLSCLEKIGNYFDKDSGKGGIPGGGDYSYQMKWPELTLEGGMKNVEIDGKHRVGNEGKLDISLSPIIGATINVNLLPVLVNGIELIFPQVKAATAALKTFVKFLNEIHGKIESMTKKFGVASKKGFEAKAELVLTVKGDISGKFGLACLPEQGVKLNDGTTITPSLEFSLEGKAQLEADTFFVEAGIGAGIAGKSAAEYGQSSKFEGALNIVKTDDGFGVEGALTYNGLAIYVMKYYYGKVKLLAGKDNDSGSGKKRSKSAGKENKDKWDKVVELIGDCSI